MQSPRGGKQRVRAGATGPTDAASDTADRQLIAVGEVMGTHGVHGDLRIKLHNLESDLLFDLPGVHLRTQGSTRWYDLEQVRPGGKGLIVRLAGVEGAEQAKALYGQELCVERSDLPELPAGEFYHCDLEGVPAVNAAGEPVGTVERVVEYPAADVLRVVGPRGVLEVPMREPYLLVVDLEAGHVMVDQLDDLEPEVSRPSRKR
jgi:16S rRNA processing protein RimM